MPAYDFAILQGPTETIDMLLGAETSEHLFGAPEFFHGWAFHVTLAGSAIVTQSPSTNPSQNRFIWSCLVTPNPENYPEYFQ